MTEPITFDAATAVSARSDGAYQVGLRQEYAIGGNKPNGGYLLACLGRAALAAARDAGSGTSTSSRPGPSTTPPSISARPSSRPR